MSFLPPGMVKVPGDSDQPLKVFLSPKALMAADKLGLISALFK